MDRAKMTTKDGGATLSILCWAEPPRPERSSAGGRRSGARRESGHRRGIVDLSIGSKEKFSPRFVIDLINGSVGLNAALVERRYSCCGDAARGVQNSLPAGR